jgi:hypothetical protein
MKLSLEFYFRQDAICAYRPAQNDFGSGSFQCPERTELFSTGRQGHCRRPSTFASLRRDESGRSTKPYQFLLGQTAFNPHRFRAELNLINTSHGPKKRSHASRVQIIVDRLYK